MDNLFTIKQLSVKTGKKTLLNINNLDLPKGEFIALIGANGAGKSTLLHSLLGIVKNCQVTGSILCEQQPIQTLVKQGKIAMVGQHEQFALPLTVLEYALLGVSPKLLWYQPPNDHDKQKAFDYLTQFELTHLADKRILHLSGGEKQRLAIVRALMQDTDILLLDEPTNHLDIKHERLLFEFLKNLVKEQKKSLVVVLHSLSHAYQYASYVVALKDGQVLAQGLPNDVMTDDNLQMMYHTQIYRHQTENGVLFF